MASLDRGAPAMISEVPYKLDLNSPDDLRYWGQSARHLAEGIDCLQGTHELVDLMAMVASGQIYWFPGSESTTLVETITYPRIKVASLFLAVGDLDEIKQWLELDGPFDTWAKQHECTRGQYVGRPGLKRVFDNIRHFGDLCIRDYD